MYEAFYKLTGNPFQLNPDPAFYFASTGHQRAFAYLEYGVIQGEGFIVITGEIGAGKTMLVRSLIERLDPVKVVAAQLVSTQLGAEDVIRAVATAFGLRTRYEDKARLLAEVEAHLMALVVARKRPLLLVDEAQNLSWGALEELRMLSNFQQGALQSFLIGQPELRGIIRSPDAMQLRQRIIASYHLGPLDRDETQAYIEHRLKRVGWTRHPEFDAEAFRLIHDYSGGIPRRVNTLCSRLMLAGVLGELNIFGAAEVAAVIREINDETGEDALLRKPTPPSLDTNATAQGSRDEAGSVRAWSTQLALSAPTSSDQLDETAFSNLDEPLRALDDSLVRLHHSIAHLERLIAASRAATTPNSNSATVSPASIAKQHP